jgi:hypothetical protein
MKFMTLVFIPADKMAEVAAASDKVWAKAPRERRAQTTYMLMCNPPDVPENCAVSFSINEGDDMEEIAASVYQMALAGAGVNIIPLLELPGGGAAKVERKYKG